MKPITPELKETIQRMFCSSDYARPALCEPFDWNEYWVATDAKQLLLIPHSLIGKANSDHKFPNCDTVVGNIPVIENVSFNVSKLKEIIVKGANEYIDVQCRNCNGSGEHRCSDCDCNHECGKCEGHGVISELNKDIPMIGILGAQFSQFRLIPMLRLIPLLEMSEIITITHKGNSGQLIFECEGIKFLIMPRLKDDDEN